MTTRYLLGVAVLSCLCGAGFADSITVAGKTFSDVYIRETPSMYYVQVPADGSVFSASKRDVPAHAVSILKDAAQRESLLNAWKSKHEPPRNASPNDAPKQAEPKPVAVASEKHQDVPLRYALKAALRSKNLDYRAENGYLYISTPQKLREEPFEPLETRYYTLKSPSGDTLPKVVVRDPAGAQVGR